MIGVPESAIFFCFHGEKWEKSVNVALIHEWLTTLGGSERVVLALHDLYPQAPLFTSIHKGRNLPPAFEEIDVRTSFLQGLPFSGRYYQKLLPLMPLAFEQFDLRGYDVVISSSHACAKGVLTSPETLHISYVHTPMRYAWDLTLDYQKTLPILLRPLAASMLHKLRIWDAVAANRVDAFLANSRTVASRIEKHYRRKAKVIHPPVDTHRFSISPRVEEHFLMVSRLVPYKRVDLAVEAFTELGWPLRVVGDGPLFGKLKAKAGSNVVFTGALPDEEVAQELSRARALVFPAFEDFGIVPVEAQASGRPVVAFGAGGATETVVEGVTGTFFSEQTVSSLVSALRRFERIDFDPQRIRAHALLFDRLVFQREIAQFVEQTLERREEREMIRG